MRRRKIVLPQDEFTHTCLIDGNKFEVLRNGEYKEVFGTIGKHHDKIWYMLTEELGVRSPSEKMYDPSTIIDTVRPHDLEMLYNISNLNINTPKWIHSSNCMDYVRELSNNKNYMLKVFNQARSMGKLRLTYEEITKLIYINRDYPLDGSNTIKEETVLRFNSDYNVDVGKTNHYHEERVTLVGISENSYYLQELVDIKEEYRVVYIKGMDTKDLVIEHRHGYSPNSSEERTHKVVDNSELSHGILGRLILFAEQLGKFTLSFDVYIDNDDNWGLLEYSTQYGVEYPIDTIEHLKKFYNKALLEITK